MGAGVTISGWQHLIPPVAATVDCGRATHTVTWQRGKLVLADHDLRAEEAAIALGGEPPRCVEVLHAWRRAYRTVRSINVDDETLAYFRQRGLRMSDQLAAALLPEALREVRERTTWLYQLRQRAELHKKSSVVRDIRRLATFGLQSSLESAAGFRDVSIDVRVVAAGQPSRVHGRRSGEFREVAAVSLPTTWLTTVALLGAVTVEGRFVLAIEPAQTLRWRRTAGGNLAAVVEFPNLVRAGTKWRLDR